MRRTRIGSGCTVWASRTSTMGTPNNRQRTVPTFNG